MMYRQHFSLAGTVLGAILALALAATPALAASHGHSGAHYSGGNHGSYHGAYGGYGYRGGYGYGYRGYGGYGYRGYGGYGYRGGSHYYRGYYPGYLGLGLGAYPYYGYGYDYAYPSYYDYSYASPVVTYAPSYYTTPPTTVVVQSGYAEPTPSDDRAHIEVVAPTADAQVFFNGVLTQQQGTEREFVSPPLTPGKTYSYQIEARWTANGQTGDLTRSVPVTAGQAAVVDFTAPPPSR